MTPPRTAAAPRRPAPAPQRPDHLRVIPGGSASGRRPLTTGVKPWSAAIATAGILFSLVLSTVFQGQLAIEETRLQRELTRLQIDLGEVELALTDALAPDAIARRAFDLGLVFPDEVGALPVRPGVR